jgi:hypothetical protein
MDWHYWGSGHGKGPHDGAGACLKQSIRKEQLRPCSRKLHGAADVVDYLKTSMNRLNGAYPAAKRMVDRHFHLTGRSEVSRANPKACATIEGTRSMHSVRSVGPANNVLLQVRNYSCFCSSCVQGGGEPCPNHKYAEPWKLVALEPVATEEAIQKGLCVGDHFAIFADPNDPGAQGAEFFVLVCTKTMYVVEEDTLVDG